MDGKVWIGDIDSRAMALGCMRSCGPMNEITKEERIETKDRPAGYSLIESEDAGPSTSHEEEWPVK